MRDRLLILAAALGALALFLTTFIGRERGFGLGPDVPRPTTGERGGSGYVAALNWLAAEHIRTVSLQDNLDKLLSRPGLPPAGNVIVVTLPVATGYRSEEFRALDRWVRAGNTLLVLAALSDQPDWAYGLGGLAASDLNLLTGLHFQPGATRAPDAAAAASTAVASTAVASATDAPFIEPQSAFLVPNRPHAYFSGVHAAVALSDFPRQSWSVSLPNDGFVLTLAHERTSGNGVLWTRRIGAGRAIVSGFGTLLTNRALGLDDNARLLANILGVHLGPGGAVLFDDVHQGLSAAYDPDDFYRDPRLYYTLGILAALWLAWVVGSTRLGMPARRDRAPREAELVRATGGFFARVLPPDEGARRIFELFFRRLYDRVPRARAADGLPWTYLERHTQVARADVRRLEQWHAQTLAARRVPLTSLHNLILRIEGQLAQ